MAQATVRGGFDTWAGSGNPTDEHGDNKFLRLSSGTQRAFVYLKVPAPRGATVLSATLRVRARQASTGTRTLTVHRIAESWKASKLNWNNQPTVTGSPIAATVGTLADGDVIAFDVTSHVQSVVNGAAHYGWRIISDAASTHRLYGFDAGDNKPTLEVVWSDKPGTPTTLVPASGIVASATPVLQFDYSDVTGDDLVAVQVQVDPAANGSSPAFDSGEVSTTEPELDLATTAYPGLAAGATTQWRVRVKDSGGSWSDWSDWVSFSRAAKGTLTIDNPAAAPNDFVSEPTPPILATLTGATLVAWQIRITPADDRTRILYDTGKRKATDPTQIAHTLPKKYEGRRVLRDDRAYSVNVRAWDDQDRVATPGDPVFTATWRDFTMTDDPTVNPIDTLAVTQVGETPVVKLAWTRSTAPDSWTIFRDGKVIESGIESADTTTGATSHTWKDNEATPNVRHTYQVKAVVNGKGSPKGPQAAITTSPEGVWIVDFNRDLSFVLSGLGVDNWRMTDQGVTYQPLGSPESVRIVQGMNGLAGSFTGMLRARSSRTLASLEQDLWKIKERPTATVQLITADLSIPVKLNDLSCSPHPDAIPGEMRKLVSFEFRQVGDLPFDARL